MSFIAVFYLVKSINELGTLVVDKLKSNPKETYFIDELLSYFIDELLN